MPREGGGEERAGGGVGDRRAADADAAGSRPDGGFRPDRRLRGETQPAWSASRDCQGAGGDGGGACSGEPGGASAATFLDAPGVVGTPGGGCSSLGNHERSTECAIPPFALHPSPFTLQYPPPPRSTNPLTALFAFSRSLSLPPSFTVPFFPEEGGPPPSRVFPSDGNDALATGIPRSCREDSFCGGWNMFRVLLGTRHLLQG